MSASKCRRVINLVRGMDAVDAVTMLKFQPQAAAEPIRKVIASAMANAEQTEGLRADDLYISQAFVDEGITMRRIRPRAKGSASRILKRSAHITVVVEPKEARQARKKAKSVGSSGSCSQVRDREGSLTWARKSIPMVSVSV